MVFHRSQSCFRLARNCFQPFFLSCMLEQVYISIFVQQAFIFFQEHRIALHGMQKSVLSLHVLGWGLLIIHIGIYSLWSFSMTLLVNILAILLGSGNAFMIIIVAQLICVTCIRLLNSLESNGTLFCTVLNINPIAHLVIGWQYSSLRGLNEAIHAPWNVMSLSGTIFYLIAIMVLILVIGGHYVHKCDLIISDLEFGGM